jgi:hypothetical protein
MHRVSKLWTTQIWCRNWQHYRYYFIRNDMSGVFYSLCRKFRNVIISDLLNINVKLRVKLCLTMYADTLSEHRPEPVNFIKCYAQCITHVITSAGETSCCVNARSQRGSQTFSFAYHQIKCSDSKLPQIFLYLNKNAEIGNTGLQWGSVTWCCQYCWVLVNRCDLYFFKIFVLLYLDFFLLRPRITTESLT